MATAQIVFLTVLAVSAALVQTAPVWQQEEDNVREGLIQYLADLTEKAEKNSELEKMFAERQFQIDLPTKRKMASREQVESMLQTHDYTIVPKWNTKLKEQEVEQKQPFLSDKVDKQDNQREKNRQTLLAEISQPETEVQAPSPSLSTISLEDEDDTPSRVDNELNLQILKKMSELKELLEKMTQLLAREQARDQRPDDFEHQPDDKEDESESKSTDESKSDQSNDEDEGETKSKLSYLLAKIMSEDIKQ